MIENSISRKKTPDTSRAKRPQQERSLLRYNALLDAAHELLKSQELEEIGLYAIAEKAGVPPASAYHFFPTPIAVFLALAERYRESFASLTLNLAIPEDRRWQTLLRQRLEDAAHVYDGTPPMQKLLLGTRTNRELAQSEAGFNATMARKLVEAFEQSFHMPLIRDVERKCLVMLTLVDAIWSLSYAQLGSITPDYLEESVLVAVAYSRTFLPEVLEPRIP